jgi:hypothetical protein
VLAGISAMLIGGYRIVDCFRFEKGRGACDTVVDTNTPAVLAGVSALVGTWGGLFTYNRKLERPQSGSSKVQLPVIPGPEFYVPPVVQQVAENAITEAVDDIASRIPLLHERGWSQRRISEHLGVSRYIVRKALGESE